MDVNKAKETLKDFEVKVDGNGKTITYQSPEAGSRILEGSKVRVYTG